MTAHSSIAPNQASAPDTLPRWDLGDLYSGRDDPRIDADLKAAEAIIADLGKLKGQLIASRANPERLGLVLAQAVHLYEQATNLILGVGAYAGLAASTARDDPAWAKMEADLRARASAIAAETLFLTLEINQLDDWELESAMRASAEAAHWRPWVRRVRLARPHELSPDLERMLVDRAPAVSNWGRLFDETLARLTCMVEDERADPARGAEPPIGL